TGDGTLVPNQWNLSGSESPAEWLTYYAELFNGSPDLFAKNMAQAKDDIRTNLADGPRALINPVGSDIVANFTVYPYAMGAWMFKMLESIVGNPFPEETVFPPPEDVPSFNLYLRQWARANQGKGAGLRSLVGHISRETETDLRPFFNAWNRITEMPT